MIEPVFVVVRCPQCGMRIQFKPVPNYRARVMKCSNCNYADIAANFPPAEQKRPKSYDITDSTVIPNAKKVRLKCMDTGESHLLSTGTNTIGRKVSEPRAAVTFNDPERFMGRLHASITVAQTPQGIQLQLKDENSSNGTFVKNIRINPNSIVKILPGDIIQFGRMRFQCIVEGEAHRPMGPLRPDDNTTM